MLSHVKETTMLWDSFDLTLPIKSTTDNRDEPTRQYESDPHELSDLCSICGEGFIGPNGCSNGCDD